MKKSKIPTKTEKQLKRFLKEHHYLLPETEEEFRKFRKEVKEKGLKELPEKIKDPRKIIEESTKRQPEKNVLNVPSRRALSGRKKDTVNEFAYSGV